MSNTRIYIVHSILPSYHTTAEKALKRAWASYGPSSPSLTANEREDFTKYQEHAAAREHYIETGKETLHNPAIDTFRPVGDLIGLPKITRAELE